MKLKIWKRYIQKYCDSKSILKQITNSQKKTLEFEMSK